MKIKKSVFQFESVLFRSVPFRSVADNDIERQSTSLDWQGSQNTMFLSYVSIQNSTCNGLILVIDYHAKKSKLST